MSGETVEQSALVTSIGVIDGEVITHAVGGGVYHSRSIQPTHSSTTAAAAAATST